MLLSSVSGDLEPSDSDEVEFVDEDLDIMEYESLSISSLDEMSAWVQLPMEMLSSPPSVL